MTQLTTHERIINLICNDVAVGLSVDEVSNESSLFDDLNLDSIQLIELITTVEVEFSIEVDDDDLDFQHFASVNSLAKFVNSLVSASSEDGAQ